MISPPTTEPMTIRPTWPFGVVASFVGAEALRSSIAVCWVGVAVVVTAMLLAASKSERLEVLTCSTLDLRQG